MVEHEIEVRQQILSYEEKKAVESRDRLRLEEIQFIKEESFRQTEPTPTSIYSSMYVLFHLHIDSHFNAS